MNNKMILHMSIGLTVIAVLWHMAWTKYENRMEITHMHHSGEATYVEGTGCEINMGADDKIGVDMNEKYIWCTTQHMNYLEGK